MSALDSEPVVSSVESDFATFGAVHLDVTDLERALAFWRDLIGLQVLATGEEDVTVLGVPGRPLVTLHPGATGPLPRYYSGLHHLAIHVPTMEDFARIHLWASQIDYPQFPTDHHTHYANYLDDADGNGLEVAFETPERIEGFEANPANMQRIDPKGDSIDLDWVRSFVPDGNLAPGLSDGAVLGHIHLRIAEMGTSLAFYRDQIGFTVYRNASDDGMYDMSAGGSFPHRMAGNNWESEGRPQRPAGTAGMRRFTLVVRSPEDLSAMVSRVAIGGGEIEQDGDDAVVEDPSGNRVVLTLADGTGR